MDADRERRGEWARGQQELRRALATPERHEEAVALFLRQHAQLHAAAMAGTGEWSFEDAVTQGLDEAQWRQAPPGAHSLAWLLWHIARIEDVTMSFLVAGRSQVLDEPRTLDGLRLTRRDVGTGTGDAEVAEVSARVDVAGLRAYRMAVGRRTREIAGALRPEDVRRRVEPARIERLLAAGVLVPAALGLAEWWSKRTTAGLLLMPATRHPFTHLNEARRLRARLKA